MNVLVDLRETLQEGLLFMIVDEVRLFMIQNVKKDGDNVKTPELYIISSFIRFCAFIFAFDVE